MKLKRLKQLRVNSTVFTVKWNPNRDGASFDYVSRILEIGVKDKDDIYIFMLLCHELMEIVAVEVGVRFRRSDCNGEYLFSYDHRQHTTMIDMFSGLLNQFIKE